MPRTKLRDREYVSWGFWLICFFVFVGPCIWLMTLVIYEETSWWAHGMFGLLIAAMVAGFLSWIVNSILQRRTERRKKADQDVRKKKKKGTG